VARQLHSHTEVELTFVLRGGMAFRLAGELVALRAGRLYVHGGLTPHAVEQVSPGTEAYSVTVPLAAFLRWALAG